MSNPNQKELNSTPTRSPSCTSPISTSPRPPFSASGTLTPPRVAERKSEDRGTDSSVCHRRDGAVAGNSIIYNCQVSKKTGLDYIANNFNGFSILYLFTSLGLVQVFSYKLIMSSYTT